MGTQLGIGPGLIVWKLLLKSDSVVFVLYLGCMLGGGGGLSCSLSFRFFGGLSNWMLLQKIYLKCVNRSVTCCLYPRFQFSMAISSSSLFYGGNVNHIIW